MVFFAVLSLFHAVYTTLMFSLIKRIHLQLEMYEQYGLKKM